MVCSGSVSAQSSKAFTSGSVVTSETESGFGRDLGAGADQASQAASYRSGLTRRIMLFARVGQTRLVTRTTISERLGSIQRLVPVKPRCPTLESGHRPPVEAPVSDGRSQPSVR